MAGYTAALAWSERASVETENEFLALHVESHAVSLDLPYRCAVDEIAFVRDAAVEHGHGLAIGVFHDAAEFVFRFVDRRYRRRNAGWGNGLSWRRRGWLRRGGQGRFRHGSRDDRCGDRGSLPRLPQQGTRIAHEETDCNH